MSMKSLIAAMPWRRRWSTSLAGGGLARHRALHDQAHLGLGHLVVAVGVVLVELGMDQRLGLGALDEAVAVGVEVLELGRGAVAALLEGRAAGHVGREGRLGDLEEFVERQLAVLVGVELLERLHAVLQEVGARDLALLGGVDFHEPLRQGHGGGAPLPAVACCAGRPVRARRARLRRRRGRCRRLACGAGWLVGGRLAGQPCVGGVWAAAGKVMAAAVKRIGLKRRFIGGEPALRGVVSYRRQRVACQRPRCGSILRRNRAQSVARRHWGCVPQRDRPSCFRTTIPQKGRKCLGGKGNFAAPAR